MGGDPRLHARESVITLGEDAGQPYDRRPAETHSLPMAIGLEVCVQLAFPYDDFSTYGCRFPDDTP